MRYLFGDSTPFPLTFDFLATLDAFVACAGNVVRLEAESKAEEKRVHAEAETRARGVEGLEKFHQTVLHAMRDSSMRSLDREVLEYATAVTDSATRYVEDTRRMAVARTEREVSQLSVEVQRRREEARTEIERFFVAATLPVLDARYSMKLHGAGKEAFHEITVVETHPQGIIAGLTLDASASTEWRHARHAGEFAPGLELMVGAKRSWFNKTVQRDVLKLDEFLLSGFELDDETAEIRLRRRLEQKDDSLVFSLKRIDTGLFADVRHPDDQELDQVLSVNVEPQDRAHLERLWQILAKAARELTPLRHRVNSIHLDMVDVFEGEKTGELIDRLIQILAPTSEEIARRSPNQSELSLKEESDDGRRREIYLRKEDLVRKLEPLAPEDRTRFQSLALFSNAEGRTVVDRIGPSTLRGPS
jgi:hypothetical protein